MSKEITIAHLTDIHIGPSSDTIRDIDVRNHFEITLRDIVLAAPDLIVLGGDQAAHCGDIEAYEWIKPRLDMTGIPYLMIPGNHDQIDNLICMFQLENQKKETGLYFSKRINGLKLLFLDSSQEVLDKNQMKWLEREASISDEAILLFMHHPPLFCNCIFMDSKYPLRNRDAVFDLLQQLHTIRHIFCGHYHIEKTIHDSGKNIYLTPSTMMQIDPAGLEYKVNKNNPGWRFIRWNGSRLETYVSYIHLAEKT